MNDLTDVQVVRHVMTHKTDYYRMLFVQRTATTTDIKVAYKKLALKCHPDKNKDPQANEAFKLVSTAHSTLADDTKRRVYDRAGAEAVQRHENRTSRQETAARTQAAGGGMRQHRPQYANQGGEDFFESFFGFGGPRRATQGGVPDDGPTVNIFGHEVNATVLMFIPLAVIFVIMLLLSGLDASNGADPVTSSFGSSQGRMKNQISDMFSLVPSPEHGLTVQRTTSLHNLQVPYYTSRHWLQMMMRRKDLHIATEEAVLRSQRDYLGNRCEADTFRNKARGKHGAPPVCTEFQRFRRAIG